eukprot:m.1296535 g.1296535  ORF g.1296535 m.1296535 type:complete len:66 (+) comp24794_c0_seq27:4607-4804(+)
MEDNILCGSCEEGLSPVGEKCQDCSKHSALYGVLLVFATVALTGTGGAINTIAEDVLLHVSCICA